MLIIDRRVLIYYLNLTFFNVFFSDFEINVVVVFRDDHLVTENFPIKLVRY